MISGKRYILNMPTSRVVAALTMMLSVSIQVGCSDETVRSPSFDLNPPWDDVKLCDLFDSGALMAAVGGVEAVSLRGANAEEIAKIEAGPGGAYPALGQCNVMLNDSQYYAVSIVDYGSAAEAADQLAQRVDLVVEFGGAAFVPVAITPGTYYDTGFGVSGHTGQYTVGCGLSSNDGSTDGGEAFADGPAVACVAVVAELATLLDSRTRR